MMAPSSKNKVLDLLFELNFHNFKKEKGFTHFNNLLENFSPLRLAKVLQLHLKAIGNLVSFNLETTSTQ